MVTTSNPSEQIKDASISDVGTMLQSFMKLVGSLQSLPVFSEGKIGYTEWLVLRLLADEPELKAGKMANKLGLSAQRTAQILIPLRNSGHLKAAPEAGDSRKNTLTITAKGQAQLKAIDQAVTAYMGPALKERPRALPMMRNFARAVLKQNKSNS
jgi:DNA-binding MarR family transcriptional regulator